jgi:hypothetical protein
MTSAYASAYDLASALGITEIDESLYSRLSLAVAVATNFVKYKIGAVVDEAETDFTGITVVDARASHKAATIVAAVRFYQSPNVPFGTSGFGGDGMTAWVSKSIPEVDLILFGERRAWGIA